MDKSSVCLLNKTCIPCHGGMPPLTDDGISRLLKGLEKSWSINKNGHLYKECRVNDFMSAIDLANKIALLSEMEGHHPNITISWGLCAIEIWTHKINGLTESDFVLGAKIDATILSNTPAH